MILLNCFKCNWKSASYRYPWSSSSSQLGRNSRCKFYCWGKLIIQYVLCIITWSFLCSIINIIYNIAVVRWHEYSLECLETYMETVLHPFLDHWQFYFFFSPRYLLTSIKFHFHLFLGNLTIFVLNSQIRNLNLFWDLFKLLLNMSTAI